MPPDNSFRYVRCASTESLNQLLYAHRPSIWTTVDDGCERLCYDVLTSRSSGRYALNQSQRRNHTRGYRQLGVAIRYYMQNVQPLPLLISSWILSATTPVPYVNTGRHRERVWCKADMRKMNRDAPLLRYAGCVIMGILPYGPTCDVIP